MTTYHVELLVARDQVEQVAHLIEKSIGVENRGFTPTAVERARGRVRVALSGSWPRWGHIGLSGWLEELGYRTAWTDWRSLPAAAELPGYPGAVS